MDNLAADEPVVDPIIHRQKVRASKKSSDRTNKYILLAYIALTTFLTVLYFITIRNKINTVAMGLWIGVGFCGIAAIIIGIVRYRPTAWLGWAFLALANLFFIAGDGYYKGLRYWFNKENPFPSLADVFYLITYPLFAAGMFVFIKHRSSAKSDRGTLLDAATLTVGIGLLVWVYLVVPNASAEDTTLLVKMASIAYPLGDVLVWAMLVRLLLIDARTRAIQLLALGALGLIFADTLWGLSQLLTGNWIDGGIADVGWLLFYIAWGAAALHPSMKTIDISSTKPTAIRKSRLILLAGAALIAPVVLLVETARGHAQSTVAVVAVFSAILFILVILRLFTLLHEVGLRDTEINLQKQIGAAIDSLDVGLLMSFRDQNNISYNSALLNILGLKEAAKSSNKTGSSLSLDSVRQKIKQIPDFDLDAVIAKCQSDGQPSEIKEAVYGSRILSVFGAPIMIQLDKIIGTVILIEDITEEKVLERSKDEFFSIASHELRTPLTSIKGNSSMILDFYKDVLKDPDLKEMIVDMHESSVRLIDIVNDFLDMSRLEQGKMSFDYEATSLEEIIESVVYEMKLALNEKKLSLKLDKLTLDKLPKIWADKNRLKQVIYNLLGNAAKFTEQGEISITVEVEGKFIKLEVADTGRGIAVDAQKLLFHKFQQAGKSLITRDTTRGTGLGLYISKLMIVGMGGDIALVSSVEGKGSTFSLTIPIATDEQKSTVSAKAPATQTDSTTGMSSVTN